MIVYKLALGILLFSLITGLYNDLGIFDAKPYNPGLANISESDVREIYKTDDTIIKGDLLGDVLALPGVVAGAIMGVVKFLGNAFSIGNVFKEYVPGIVGQLIGNMINTVVAALYLWGAAQIILKFTSKNTD